VTRPETTGFQKPLHGGTREVGLAVISYEGSAAQCSCGAVVAHKREKVRENWIDRHLEKKHGGRGIRL